MKKLLTFSVALVLVLAVSACGAPGDGGSSAPPQTSGSGSVTDNENVSGAVTGSVRTGLGTVVSLASSKSANEEKPASAQADVTMCAASFDDKGVIVSIYIDSVQGKVAFDEAGKLTTDVEAAVSTKRELGDSYGMKAVSGIDKEWYEQIEALEKWMTGKTVDEVLGLKVTGDEAEHPGAPDDAELNTSVTISVTEYLEALKLAYENAK